jgi:glycosyltransferase involved in cell wall biosynthesis
VNASKVQVLLSTYNGEKYLKEQLDSLLAQDYPSIDILIRDDGSKDSTKQILTRYEDHKNIRVIYGSNIGITASFLELLKISEPEAEFFCLLRPR